MAMPTTILRRLPTSSLFYGRDIHVARERCPTRVGRGSGQVFRIGLAICPASLR